MPTDRHPQPRRHTPLAGGGRRPLSACRRPALAALAALALCGVALAQPSSGADPRTDPATGRDRRIWPPDVLFDHRHMRLEVTIPDMHVAAFRGRCTLTLAPIGAPRSSLRLDAGPALTFSSITVDGREAAFERSEAAITIDLGRSYAPGEQLTVVMDYSAVKPGGRGAGLTFSKDDPDTPEDDPMCHAQGQPQTNHLWFPCHDFPNERLSSEVIATVPDGFTAISNGRLLEVRRTPARGDAPASVTYHWRQDLDHPVYLVTLVVGRFDIVEVGGPDTARPGLWMPVYGPLGSADVLARNFRTTPDMVALFERLFDEPFPWDKFANIACRDFAAGAMENSSAVTWAQSLATGRADSVEGTNAHELVHQWFGDLVGYKSWEHLWLGEGWATYGEALWAEHKGGQAAYQREIARMAGSTRAMARGRRPQTGGMVSNLYDKPDQRFFGADNVYSKGGWVIHALRARLGDDAFWKGVRLYIDRHKFQQVETDDFRRALEDASGHTLERFFEQFAVRPGIPRLRVDLGWNDDDSALTVTITQTQHIDADNPAYAFSLPILLDYGGGEHDWVFVDVDTTTTTAIFPLPTKPAKVTVDPTATIPAQHRIETSLSMLLDQLRSGPTPYARLCAAESLAFRPEPQAAIALALAAASPVEDPVIRSAAARSLAATAASHTDRVLAALRTIAAPTRAFARADDVHPSR
jgi:aminopeptidase N